MGVNVSVSVGVCMSVRVQNGASSEQSNKCQRKSVRLVLRERKRENKILD